MAKTVLVTGDAVCDHSYYTGERSTADSEGRPGFRPIPSGGGALLLYGLIEETLKEKSDYNPAFGLDLKHELLPLGYHAFCLWQPMAAGDGDEHSLVWRAVEPPLGYGHPSDAYPAHTECQAKKVADQHASIVVIDDAGISFRKEESSQLWPQLESAEWVVLKFGGEIEASPLWKKIAEQSSDRHVVENLVVIVSADQIRKKNVRLSWGLSWEATVEDLWAELNGNPGLAQLKMARHLIVTFRTDAAFWLNNGKDREAVVVFDSDRGEGEWEASRGKGQVYGYQSCFTAAIVNRLCEPSNPNEPPGLEPALSSGLSAARELWRAGHGPYQVKNDNGELVANGQPGFPFKTIARVIQKPSNEFVTIPLPTKFSRRNEWMMLDDWRAEARSMGHILPHDDVAFALAIMGPKSLRQFPAARFNKYQTVDRSEIENLRIIRQLVVNYRDSIKKDPKEPERPLCLGVFGPPGAGKSFGVKQIAKAVLGKDVEILTFNLSQFGSSADLNGAFHQVRDKVLMVGTGGIPVVFWDEFDSKTYDWLQYLLAPMQDGVFQDGQVTHPIGKCVFVFAGATSPTYESFGPLDPDELSVVEDEESVDRPNVACQDQNEELSLEQRQEISARWRDFAAKKGPDFKSRLVGHLNVLGPNRRLKCEIVDGIRQFKPDQTDSCCSVRRAFFIRSQFDLGDSQELKLDRGVVRALLEVDRYKAGSRSLEFICKCLRQGNPDFSRRSNLPGFQLLDMHVNAAEFWRLCERDEAFLAVAHELAPVLHLGYKIMSGSTEDMDKDKELASIHQARRIPVNLRLLGLRLVEGTRLNVDYAELPKNRSYEDREIIKYLNKHINLIAEAEHNGWMVERMLHDWHYSQLRDNSHKHHDLLIPYNQLSEDYKDYDRFTIAGCPAHDGKEEQCGYVDIVKLVGFRVEKVPF